MHTRRSKKPKRLSSGWPLFPYPLYTSGALTADLLVCSEGAGFVCGFVKGGLPEFRVSTEGRGHFANVGKIGRALTGGDRSLAMALARSAAVLDKDAALWRLHALLDQ
jgi:hypothetical protein